MVRILCFFALLTCSLGWAQDPQQDQYTELNGDYAASHILVAYQGSLRGDTTITRNIPEAKARIMELFAQVTADPSKFEAIALKESDGASGPTNGYLGSVAWGKFDPKFEKEIKRLAEGQISKEPIETSFGFHIVRREPMRVKNYALNLFVITYRGAELIEGIAYRSENRRQTKEQAAEKIKEWATKLTPENFADMVRQGDFRKPGGFYGNIQRYDSTMTQDLTKELEKIEYGQLTGVLDLPFGYAIAQRIKVERLGAARVLILHNRVKDAPAWMTRTKDEAMLLAQDVLAQVQANPADFGKVAKKLDEGLYRGKGGVLPPWLKGAKEKAFEEALLSVEVGQVYPQVLDFEEGLMVIQRLDPSANQ